MGPLSPNINYITFSDTSWVLYGRGEGVVEFRDKVVSLGEAVLDMWVVVAISEVMFGMAWFFYKGGMIEDELFTNVCIGFVFIGIFIAIGCLGCLMVLLRWWTPSFVRISGGMMSIHQPHRWRQPVREFKTADIAHLQTSAGNKSFHSLYSHGVWLKDGTKICFLRARDTAEAKWVLLQLERAVGRREALLNLEMHRAQRGKFI